MSRTTDAVIEIHNLRARIAELEAAREQIADESAATWVTDVARTALSIPNPRRDDSEMAGRSGNLSDLTGE